MSDYPEEREAERIKQDAELRTTGLRELLKRNGIEPTGDSEQDIKLAKEFMPRGLHDINR